MTLNLSINFTSQIELEKNLFFKCEYKLNPIHLNCKLVKLKIEGDLISNSPTRILYCILLISLFF